MTWVPYREGDPIPADTRNFWVVMRGYGSNHRWVDIAERTEHKDRVFFYQGDYGNCSDRVTHYSPLPWPELPKETT